MAQHDRGHLTTEQLSALLDKQLSLEEQAVFNAHLRTCQQCQSILSDLRQTVNLLHALPKAELPRSFVLPTGIALVSEQRTQSDTTVRQFPRNRGRGSNVILRSIRYIGAIAAVLGLFLFLSGYITTLPHFGGSASSSSSGSNATIPGPSSSSNMEGTHKLSPDATRIANPAYQRNCTSNVPDTASPVLPSPRCNSPVAQASQASTPTTAQNQPIPPALNLSRPEGHEWIGLILFIAGILIIILTRRRGQRAR